MLRIENKKFTIYFGDVHASISLDEIAAGKATQSLHTIAERVQAQRIFFLKQDHGVQGAIMTASDQQSQFFQSTGDYLITQQKNYGIGVVTADCLPIVLYDSVTHAAAIVHAGWKGLRAGILQKTVQELVATMQVLSENLELYLGPAAGPCCYEVQQDFVDSFVKYQDCFHEIFIKKDVKTYFDLQAFIIVLARNLGIEKEKLYTRYNVCTICNLSFCSYRREQAQARRQVTMICLH